MGDITSVCLLGGSFHIKALSNICTMLANSSSF